MMQGFEPKQLTALYGAVLPISILLIENQEDRQFMADLYLQSNGSPAWGATFSCLYGVLPGTM